ncbi:MAG: protein-disulfide isomerase [Rickettsiales bacterium]|jgi:protein-disulfide isomerase
MKNNNKISIVLSILISIIAIIFFIINNRQESAEIEESNLTTKEVVSTESGNVLIEKSNHFLNILDSDHILGKKEAPVRVIEYASLSCSHCAEFYSNGFPNLKPYIDRGDVVFIYRDFPLNGPALAGAVAAECYYNKVKQSYKYHDFIKTLFKNQEKWAFSSTLMKKLEEISVVYGVSAEELKFCIDSEDMKRSIVSEAQEASKSINIKSTPTFLINGEVINGYSGWSVLEEVIDRKLKNL